MATIWQQNYQLYRRYIRNLALMYQKRQDVRAFVELLLSLSAISIFGIFAIRPTAVTILELNNQITGERETVRLLDAKIVALAEAQEVFDRNNTNLPLVNNAIPENPTPEGYVRQIEGLANRHSLLVLDMNTKEIPILGVKSELESEEGETEEDVVDYFPLTSQYFEFELTVIGDFAQVHSFLGDFERMRRPMFEDIVNIRLSQGELPGELALSVTGRLAYLPK